MCKAQERAQRRHRAMYLAPSARPLHANTEESPDSSDQVIPLLVEIPDNNQSNMRVISPPSSVEASPPYEWTEQRPPPSPRLRSMLDALHTIYQWLVDVILLVLVCVMGCFFYDVEVKVIKANRQRGRCRGGSGRVVIRTNEAHEQGMTTSLLRTPPLSGASRGHLSRSSSPSPPDSLWDVV